MPVAITFTFFFIVYRFVPRRVATAATRRSGPLLATMLWETAKDGVRLLHPEPGAQYAGIYGTLEGIIVLALWLEISVSIILYCGEVVALLIHQKTAARTAKAAGQAPSPAHENVGGAAAAP